MTLTYILRSSDFDTIYVDVPTIRHTTTKPCLVLLLDVLTLQVPWPGDLNLYFALHWLWHTLCWCSISPQLLGPQPSNLAKCFFSMYWLGRYLDLVTLYFGCSDIDIIYVNIPDLLKCKTSSHQTLHSASPRCTDSTGILTWWPWPIFCAPVPFTHFTSTFSISSTIRPTTTKSCIVLLLNVQTPQVPWLGAVRLETRRSRVQPPPRSATFFHRDWSWNIFYGHSLPSADSRRAVISFWRKNVHNTTG